MFGNRNGRGRGRGRGRGCACKECICPQCKTIVSHTRGIPCFHTRCPKCNTPMMARLNSDYIPEKK